MAKNKAILAHPALAGGAGKDRKISLRAVFLLTNMNN